LVEGTQYQIYKDIGSGSGILPSLELLLNNVKAGHIKMVVCTYPSIISRNAHVLQEVVNDFKIKKMYP